MVPTNDNIVIPNLCWRDSDLIKGVILVIQVCYALKPGPMTPITGIK